MHSYILINELFKHLKEIYNELNRNWKCHCKYNALKQANKSFNVFYFNFMKLFNYLDYDDCTLMNNLQNKINNCLQNALSICSENFTSLTRLRIFLQDVNNKQWVNYQLRSERCIVIVTVIIKVMIVSDKHVATSLLMTTSIINYVKSIIFSTSESTRLFIICYTCKISSHLLKNCSQNKINTSASHVFKLITSSRVLEFESSTRLIKTQFESEFLTWVFELSWDVQLKYSSRVRELKLSIDSKFSTWLVKTWR